MFYSNKICMALVAAGSLFFSSGAAFAQTDSLTVADTGNVGIGTETPEAPLHILRASATPAEMFRFTNARGSFITWEKEITNASWFFTHENSGRGALIVDHAFGTAFDGPEFLVDTNGNMEIQGTLTEGSDVDSKQDIRELEGEFVLARLAQLPIAEWRYKTDPEVRHVGPMAQDFYAAFGLGVDDKHIAARDMAGINMAAIKALQAAIQALKTANARKDAELATLRAELDNMRSKTNDVKTLLEALLADQQKEVAIAVVD